MIKSKKKIQVKSPSEMGKIINEPDLSPYPDGGYLITIQPFYQVKKTRTNPQNAALHLFFDWLAIELNAEGHTQKLVFDNLKDGSHAAWDRDSTKNLWRIMQRALVQKNSTSELTTTEVDKIYSALQAFFLARMNFTITEFPTRDDL
tara:strand:- start:2135 stop:2575 length:441 start_codon:yes stop_codon:yes gene_type:complete